MLKNARFCDEILSDRWWSIMEHRPYNYYCVPKKHCRIHQHLLVHHIRIIIEIELFQNKGSTFWTLWFQSPNAKVANHKIKSEPTNKKRNFSRCLPLVRTVRIGKSKACSLPSSLAWNIHCSLWAPTWNMSIWSSVLAPLQLRYNGSWWIDDVHQQSDAGISASLIGTNAASLQHGWVDR